MDFRHSGIKYLEGVQKVIETFPWGEIRLFIIEPFVILQEDTQESLFGPGDKDDIYEALVRNGKETLENLVGQPSEFGVMPSFLRWNTRPFSKRFRNWVGEGRFFRFTQRNTSHNIFCVCLQKNVITSLSTPPTLHSMARSSQVLQ